MRTSNQPVTGRPHNCYVLDSNVSVVSDENASSVPRGCWPIPIRGYRRLRATAIVQG